MALLILGSRTYQPLSDVAATDQDYAFGVSPVAVRAQELGAKLKALETTRGTLIAMALGADTEVVMYCARDAETKQLTSGMTQIQHLLTENGIEFRVVSSPFSGAICELVTNLKTAVDKAIRALPGARHDLALSKALGFAGLVVDKRDEYERKMEEGFNFWIGDLGLDDKWIRWVHTYQLLSDSLKDAERVLK